MFSDNVFQVHREGVLLLRTSDGPAGGGVPGAGIRLLSLYGPGFYFWNEESEPRR